MRIPTCTCTTQTPCASCAHNEYAYDIADRQCRECNTTLNELPYSADPDDYPLYCDRHGWDDV